MQSSETAIAFDAVGFEHRTPVHVAVTVDRPVGAEFPTLAPTLARRLSEHTGYHVVVDLRFVDIDRSDSAEPST